MTDRYRENLQGKPLTPNEWKTLATYARIGNQQEVADNLGVARQTVKNNLGMIYAKLGVDNAISAYATIGWLKVPEEKL